MKQNFRRAALACQFACALAAVAATSVHAQTYPTRPVTLVVPFSAGGDSDQSARNLAVTAQEVLGQPVVVVNRAGANGAIGSQAVKDAPADGYTLLLARVGSQTLLPALKPPGLNYKWNDFTFLGLLELNPVVCVVHPDSSYRTLADLARELKARPGKLNYSTSGPATVPSLAPQLLLLSLELKPNAAVAVNYKGGGEATVAVMSRDVDFTCNNLSSMTGQIAGGKLRPLMTTTPERLKQLPDVPTARELGYPQMEAVVGWSALYGPPRMNPDAVKRWTDVLHKAASDPRWIAGNSTYGGIPKILSQQETEKYVAESYKAYVKLIEQTGIELK